ncbi:MAG: transcriptional regulator NrdR [Kiritimatiellia bacterium]|jgi:transcriptional repressor NrdR
MKCPKCGQDKDKVLDSRSARDGSAIRRRRECQECNQRFTTYEEIVKDSLRVVKRDGRHEEFSRVKLQNGIQRACEKRPVSAAQISSMIDSILDELDQEFDIDVPSSAIGQKVMDKLEKLDVVAYVRFASVYKRFADVNQFLNAVRDIVQKN